MANSIDTDIDYKRDLAEKLQGLKQIEGFPIGEDKDILALSEPPFYTACPNPFIADFISEHGKPYDETNDKYHCEPFVGDVSEGKNNTIYNAHSYHTKVPHKAIMKYIEHYTNENDIVLDGFCGSGMTGVASRLLNRHSILSDLSPIATFVSYNYNRTINVEEYKRNCNSILEEVESECGWMYETAVDLPIISQLNIFSPIQEIKSVGKINYTVWSDVFLCPYCKTEYNFWAVAVDKEKGKVLEEYPCPSCSAKIKKRDCSRAEVTFYDKYIQQEITQAKQVPVLINFTARVKKKGKWKEERFIKTPDQSDIDLINRIDNGIVPYWFPSQRIIEGDEARRNDRTGITHVHHFYTKRNLWILSKLYEVCCKYGSEYLVIFESISTSLCTKLARYNLGNRGNGPVSGTLYISSMTSEANVIKLFSGKASDFQNAYLLLDSAAITYLNCSSTSNLETVPSNSIDYVFTDPPFGDNLMYSELNFLWEAWLKVTTNNKSEAIINKTQRKGLPEYYDLMLSSFNEYYRVLKPNRWITVEFHNSKSSVWNSIQEGMTKAGFIIAQVSVLDKQQGSFKQVTAPGAVEKDLVISAYKPTKTFEEKFLKQAGENLEVDFIFQFLDNLPKRPSVERTDKMLYSKMLAYYIQRGYEVRQDSKSFYRLLNNNFISEDGFWFTPSQIGSYREFKQKMKLEGLEDFKQGSMMLFITDENSALLWLFNFLSEPKSFSDVSTAFTQLAEIQGDKVPDLKEMLNENFVYDNNKYRRPQGEAETVSLTEKRERALMREFESLLIEAKSSKKKIAVIRKEAVLYGFEVCYKQNRFEDMLTLASRLDSSILENSSELTEFVEIARIKVEGIK